MVVDPPPSRLIASEAPRLRKSRAKPARVIPTDLRGCLPSTVTSTTSPEGVTPIPVRGWRLQNANPHQRGTRILPSLTRSGLPPITSRAWGQPTFHPTVSLSPTSRSSTASAELVPRSAESTIPLRRGKAALEHWTALTQYGL